MNSKWQPPSTSRVKSSTERLMADTVLYVDMWVGDRIQGMKLAGIRGREFSALVSARRETGIGDCTIVTWDEEGEEDGVRIVPAWKWLL